MTNKTIQQALDLRHLLQNFSVYGGVSVTSKLINLVSIPLLTHHLTISDYGVLEYFYTLSYLLVVVLICGQDAAIARFFYECKDSRETQRLVTTSLLFQLMMLAALIPALWMFGEQILTMTVDVVDKEIFLNLVLLQVPFLLVVDFSSNLLKWAMARTQFVVLTLGFAFCQVSALIATTLIFELNVFSALAANCFSSVVFSLLGLFYIRNWLAWPCDFLYLKKSLPFAFPIGLVSIIICLQPIIERTMINSFLGLESLGIHALASKVMLIVVLVFSAFQSAWGPYAMASWSKNETTKNYSLVLKIFCVFGSSFILLVGLFTDPLIRLLGGDRYLSGTTIVTILAFSQLLQNVGWILELGIRISKKTYLTTFAFLAGLFVMVTLANQLASSYELLGVAIGILAGKLTALIITSIMAHSVHRIPCDYWSISIMLGLTSVIVFGGVATRIVCGTMASLLTIASGLCLILIWSWFQLFTYSERRIIKNTFGILTVRS